MAKPAVALTTSYNVKSWSDAVKSGPHSHNGIQMAVFRGELCGVMVGIDQHLYTTKYENDEQGGSWSPISMIPDNWQAQGRASVTTLDDRFYLAFRGLNETILTLWSDDFVKWNNAGVFDTKFLTKQSPAIAGYNGNLHMVCTGKENQVWHAIRQGRTHKVLQGWTSFGKNHLSQRALAMCVHHSSLYVFYTSNDFSGINSRRLRSGEKWVDMPKITTYTTSGPSAISFKTNQIIVTTQNKENEMRRFMTDENIKGTTYMVVPNCKMVGTTGMASYLGQCFVSYAMKPGSDDHVHPLLKSGMELDEKAAFTHVEEVSVDDDEDSEWDCKWQEDDQPKSKSFLRKLICM